MADGLNKVMLFGNLGADPELRFTQGGQAVLNIRLAINESYLDKDKQRKQRTEWVSVVVWGNRGEALAKIMRKGSSVMIEGSLRSSSYDDRDGNKRYKTEVVAQNVILAGSRNGQAGDASSESHGRNTGPRSGAAPSNAPAPQDDYGGYGGNSDDSDIPF